MKALVVLAALLGAFRARADGCLGLPYLRCGPTATLLEVRPGLSSPLALSPGVGAQVGRDFRLWTLDAALFGNALQLFNKSASGAELSAAVFGCERKLGVCAGPLVVLAGPDGGLVREFTWRKSIGAVVSASGDLLSFLTTAVH